MKVKFYSLLKILFPSLLILILSFPKFDLSYSIGCDPALMYAYNYFFDASVRMGSEIIFTYGPLGFLKSPLPVGNNLPIGIAFICISRLLFISLFLFLSKSIHKQSWLWYSGLAFVLCLLADSEYILLGITVLGLLIYLENNSAKWLIFPLMAAVVALFIKASSGVICLLVLFSFAAYIYYEKRNWKIILILFLGIPSFFISLWLLIYGDLGGAGTFLWGTLQLAKDNSAAVSLYPANNWFLLIIAISIFLVLPFLFKEKRINILYILLLLSVFAAWKHGYSREENYHLKAFYDFLILFFIFYFLLLDSFKLVQLVLVGSVLLLVHKNMELTKAYNIDDKIEFSGLNNFSEIFFNYHKTVQDGIELSSANISANKLPTELVERIGKQTVDVYPLDFSYIPANNFNWVSKPVIQTYASYTSWLDKKNANYFSSDKSAKFIIWAMSGDMWNSDLGSMDGRFLLNDEPNAIIQLLNNYSVVYKTAQWILLEKSRSPNVGQKHFVKRDTCTWNQWVSVPDVNDGILRTKVNIKGNFFRFVKAQFYKDEAFFAEYMLKSGVVKKYRIVPANAIDGLWINPLLSNIHDTVDGDVYVEKIRFSCTNDELMKDEITLDWEIFAMNKQASNLPKKYKYESVLSWFRQYPTMNEKKNLSFTNNFEAQCYPWSTDTSKICHDIFYRGKKSFQFASLDQYSSTFTYSMDSLEVKATPLTVTTKAWVKVSEIGTGKLVMSLEDKNKNTLFWDAISLEAFLNGSSIWGQVYMKRTLPLFQHEGAVLKVYIMKDANEPPIYIDDFNVSF